MKNIHLSPASDMIKKFNEFYETLSCKSFEDQKRINDWIKEKLGSSIKCDHAGAMYKVYQIDRLGINGHDIHFGINKCSRCGYKDYWQVDI